MVKVVAFIALSVLFLEVSMLKREHHEQNKNELVWSNDHYVGADLPANILLENQEKLSKQRSFHKINESKNLFRTNWDKNYSDTSKTFETSEASEQENLQNKISSKNENFGKDRYKVANSRVSAESKQSKSESSRSKESKENSSDESTKVNISKEENNIRHNTKENIFEMFSKSNETAQKEYFQGIKESSNKSEPSAESKKENLPKTFFSKTNTSEKEQFIRPSVHDSAEFGESISVESHSEESEENKSDDSEDHGLKELTPVKHTINGNVLGKLAKLNQTAHNGHINRAEELIKVLVSNSDEDNSDTAESSDQSNKSDESNQYELQSSLDKNKIGKVHSMGSSADDSGDSEESRSDSSNSQVSQESSTEESSKEKAPLKSMYLENILAQTVILNETTHKEEVTKTSIEVISDNLQKTASLIIDAVESNRTFEGAEFYKEENITNPEVDHVILIEQKSDEPNDLYESGKSKSAENNLEVKQIFKENILIIPSYSESLNSSSYHPQTSRSEEKISVQSIGSNFNKETILLETKANSITHSVDEPSQSNRQQSRENALLQKEKVFQSTSKVPSVSRKYTTISEQITQPKTEELVPLQKIQNDTVKFDDYITKENVSTEKKIEQKDNETLKAQLLNGENISDYSQTVFDTKLDETNLHVIIHTDNRLDNTSACSDVKTEEIFPEESDEEHPVNEIPKILSRIRKVQVNIHKKMSTHSELVNYIIQEVVASLKVKMEVLRHNVLYLHQKSNETQCTTTIFQEVDFDSQFIKCRILKPIRFIERLERTLKKEAKTFNQGWKRCQLKPQVFERNHCLRQMLTKMKINLFKIEKAVGIYLKIDMNNRQSCVVSTFDKFDKEIYISFTKISICVAEYIGLK